MRSHRKASDLEDYKYPAIDSVLPHHTTRAMVTEILHIRTPSTGILGPASSPPNKTFTIHPHAPRIPPELYRPIISHIQDLRTLYALSLTCHILRHEANRLLYARMSQTHGDASKYTQIAFLTTLLSHNPRLAPLVREYHSHSIVDYARNPLWDLTRAALRQMTHLKRLHFRAFGGHPAAQELLVGCSFRLEKLDWGCHSDEQAMARVLVEQQELEELYLEGRQGTIFPRAACPRLVALGGNRAIVEALLPGRNVRRLAWIPDLEDSITDSVDGMETELGKLHTLSFGGYFCRPSFELLVYQLRSLEVLELIGLGSMEELKLIQHLPSLRELVVSLRWGSSHFPIPAPSRALVVQTLFDDRPTLSLVDIAHDWPSVGLIRYQRWTRCVLDPVLVSSEQVRMGRFMH